MQGRKPYDIMRNEGRQRIEAAEQAEQDDSVLWQGSDRGWKEFTHIFLNFFVIVIFGTEILDKVDHQQLLLNLDHHKFIPTTHQKYSPGNSRLESVGSKFDDCCYNSLCLHDVLTKSNGNYLCLSSCSNLKCKVMIIEVDAVVYNKTIWRKRRLMMVTQTESVDEAEIFSTKQTFLATERNSLEKNSNSYLLLQWLRWQDSKFLLWPNNEWYVVQSKQLLTSEVILRHDLSCNEFEHRLSWQWSFKKFFSVCWK